MPATDACSTEKEKAPHDHGGPLLPFLSLRYYGLEGLGDQAPIAALLGASQVACQPCQQHWLAVIADDPLMIVDILALGYLTMDEAYPPGSAPTLDILALTNHPTAVAIWSLLAAAKWPEALATAQRAAPQDRRCAVQDALDLLGGIISRNRIRGL